MKRSTLRLYFPTKISKQFSSCHLFLKTHLFIFKAWLFHECECFAYMCVWCPQRKEENTKSPEIEVVDSGELLYGCWQLDLDPLQEHLIPHL